MLESLPTDVLAYIRVRNTFDYDPSTCECGQVALLAEDDLQMYDFNVSGPEFASEPPCAEYMIRCISLLKSADGYHPVGILNWMVDDEMFCTWDEDHENIIAFGTATWADIVADPALYLSAQWNRDDYFEPWKHGYKPA